MITSEEKFLLNRMNSVANKTQLGELVDRGLNCLKVTYDVAVDGGAVGAHTLELARKLPSGAIIKDSFVDIVTAFASAGGNGTLALHAQSAGDLLAAVDADTLANQVQCIPNGAVANMIKLTAERNVVATVAVEALTQGKADIYVLYVS